MFNPVLLYQNSRKGIGGIMNITFGVLMLAVGLLLSGCATNSKPALLPGGLNITISTCPYQIGPLDTATITLADGTTRQLTVSHEGTLDLNSGRKAVAGESVADFKAVLKTDFPEAVKIEVTEFKDNRISVLGEVFHQLHTELGNGPMRLMDAIAAANGFTSLADKQHVRLVRENAGVVETYEVDFRQLMRGENMQQNILIQAGDVITVPRDFL
jgi:polysaccharide export outer membrane protein